MMMNNSKKVTQRITGGESTLEVNRTIDATQEQSGFGNALPSTKNKKEKMSLETDKELVDLSRQIKLPEIG